MRNYESARNRDDFPLYETLLKEVVARLESEDVSCTPKALLNPKAVAYQVDAAAPKNVAVGIEPTTAGKGTFFVVSTGWSDREPRREDIDGLSIATNPETGQRFVAHVFGNAAEHIVRVVREHAAE